MLIISFVVSMTMAQSEFAVIQFDEEGGNGLAVVNTKWLTPRKTEVFWPPFKDRSLFNKALKSGQEINDKWKIYTIKRKFFETDDLETAQKKLKRAEETSDLSSSVSEIESETSRRRLKRKPYRYIDDSEEEEEVANKSVSSRFQRPEKVNFLQNGNIDLIDQNLSQPSTSQQSRENVLCQSQPEVDKQLTLNRIQEDYRSLLKEICAIKEQNVEILNCLKSNSSATNRVTTSICPELPVKLPNTNFEEVETLENFLKNEHQYVALRAYLSSLGGSNVAARTNKILKNVLDDSLASKLNFLGSRNQDTKREYKFQMVQDIFTSFK